MMNKSIQAVLLVDDEQTILSLFANVLASAGITNVETCSSKAGLVRAIAEEEYSLVCLDLVMPGVAGLELLDYVLQEAPGTPVIVVTATQDIEIAIDCMKRGAFDFVVKPVNVNRLLSCVRHALTEHEVRRENMFLRDAILSGRLRNPLAFRSIVTAHDAILSIFRYIEAVATTSLHILITGETGVGKELFARAIHLASGRKGEFIAVNVAGLDDHMFSDTLFGHEKGAYTGAEGVRKGIIAKASDGTLFLDEIGDLSHESQVKLLRLIQEKEYYPIGSDSLMRSSARFVFATNRDLERLVESGKFRRDLYYRLASHHIRIPPLRERRADIVPLVDHFWGKGVAEFGIGACEVPDDLARRLATYDFPGNVRELEGIVEESLIHLRKEGSLSGFLERMLGIESESRQRNGDTQAAEYNPFVSVRPLPTIRRAVDFLLDQAMERSGGNQGKAAEMLGITRTALNKRLRKNRDAPYKQDLP